MSGIESKGNFNTGEFQVFIDGYLVLDVKLAELDQHSEHFQGILNGSLNKAISDAYRIGYDKCKTNMIKALESA